PRRGGGIAEARHRARPDGRGAREGAPARCYDRGPRRPTHATADRAGTERGEGEIAAMRLEGKVVVVTGGRRAALAALLLAPLLAAVAAGAPPVGDAGAAAAPGPEPAPGGPARRP